MALKKTISINGTVNVMTEHGPIPDGQKIVSLNCYIKVENVTSTKSVANAVVKFTDNNRSISKTYIFEPDMVIVTGKQIGRAHV